MACRIYRPESSLAVSILWLMYRANLFSICLLNTRHIRQRQLIPPPPRRLKWAKLMFWFPSRWGAKKARDSLNDLINDYNAMAKTANDELIPALAK